MTRVEVDQAALAAVEVGVMIRDPAPMLDFYLNVLGLTPYGNIHLPFGHVWGLRLGDCIVKLVYDRSVPDSSNPLKRSTGIRYLTLRLCNVAEVYAKAIAAGHGVQKPLSRFNKADGTGGVDFAILFDPEGNWIELVGGSAWSPLGNDFSAALAAPREAQLRT